MGSSMNHTTTFHLVKSQTHNLTNKQTDRQGGGWGNRQTNQTSEVSLTEISPHRDKASNAYTLKFCVSFVIVLSAWALCLLWDIDISECWQWRNAMTICALSSILQTNLNSKACEVCGKQSRAIPKHGYCVERVSDMTSPWNSSKQAR